MGKWPVDEIYGGVAVHTVNLITEMSKLEGLKLYYISFGKESQIIKMNNAKIVIIKIWRIYYILPFLPLFILKWKTNKIKSDIFQIQGSNLSPYLIYALLSCRKNKILNIYGLIFKETSFKDENLINSILRFLSIRLESYAISKIPTIIVESSFIKKLIAGKTESMIQVIPDGIEIEKIQQSQKDYIEMPDIFVASRLVNLKGIDILIKSINAVKKKLPNIKVFIAGSGPHKDELVGLTRKLGLEKNINFLGYISDNDKYAYYNSCKIVVVPSRWDCSPIGIFEAMGAGKPVIASDNTNSEILEDSINGFIFESENFQSLSEKILILLTNKEIRQKMSYMAKKKALKYDWNNIAESYFKIYENVIENSDY